MVAAMVDWWRRNRRNNLKHNAADQSVDRLPIDRAKNDDFTSATTQDIHTLLRFFVSVMLECAHIASLFKRSCPHTPFGSRSVRSKCVWGDVVRPASLLLSSHDTTQKGIGRRLVASGDAFSLSPRF
jgi:hypothetical protein